MSLGHLKNHQSELLYLLSLQNFTLGNKGGIFSSEHPSKLDGLPEAARHPPEQNELDQVELQRELGIEIAQKSIPEEVPPLLGNSILLKKVVLGVD